VRYVFAPHAPLVASSQREVELLETSAAFELVSMDQSWTVYRLRRSKPIVEPLAAHARAGVLWIDHTTLRFRASRRGAYRVRLTDSPYWVVLRSEPAAPGSHRTSSRRGAAASQHVEAAAAVRRGAHRMLVVCVPAAGVYTLSFDAGRTFADRLESLKF
jgi:hypothetical protein